jgi:hypothetical protein
LRQTGEAIHHLGSVSQTAGWLEAERIDFRPTQGSAYREIGTERRISGKILAAPPEEFSRESLSV